MQSMWTTGRDLRIDAPIFSADGRHLGVVKEIRRHAFKVDAPMARDYWLTCDAVAAADDRRVTLHVDERRLDNVKRDEPRDDTIPREYRAREYDETWRETDTDYPGPDYLDAGRNWERVPRQPDFSYASWEPNRDRNQASFEWDEPREPFYRDSDPQGYRGTRGDWRSRQPVGAAYQDDDRWSQGRNEFTRTSGQTSRYRSPAGTESGVPRYDQERGWGYQGQGGWNARFGAAGTYARPFPTPSPSGGSGAAYSGQPGRGYDREEWGEGQWFDSEAPAGYSGRGPRSYSRPDDSICAEVCERLTYAGDIDATDIEVTVRGGAVTLTGTVEDHKQRHRAEDVAQAVSGVRDIQNKLRANRERSVSGEAPTYLV